MQQEKHVLAHLRFGWVMQLLGQLFNLQKELVQCLCLPSCNKVLIRHQHFCLGHWLLLETFWAVLAEVSNATTAEASRRSADLLDIRCWRL